MKHILLVSPASGAVLDFIVFVSLLGIVQV